MSGKEVRQYGLWESSITPGSLAGDRRLRDVQWDTGGGSLLLWLEGRSDRGVLVTLEEDGNAPRDLTSDLSVGAEVGYGGGDFTAHQGVVYFLAHKTGRIHRQTLSGGGARPITPAFGKAASPVVSPDGRWLAYVHQDEERVDRIAVVDAEGRFWPQVFTVGHDFYMQPRWSRDGKFFAWIAWDHPNMPWDGTLLYLASVEYERDRLPRLGPPRVIAGGDETAVFQPEFTPDGRGLLYVSDETGWGHLWRFDLGEEKKRCLTTGEAEYGIPAWNHGLRTYAVIENGRHAIAARSERGFVKIQRVDLESGACADVEELGEYTDAAQFSSSAEGERVAFVGSSPATPARLVVHDFTSGTTSVAARASGETVSRAALSRPEALVWETAGGELAHGLFYPPASDRFEGKGKPPLLVTVHGGPTGQVRAAWSAQAQYFATRGYAVLCVNYRGSTGYGRAYMLRLRGNWGICDVEDSVSGARHVALQGRADGERTAILGGSAGGFTVLQTMVTHPEAFMAGVCLFGISNQFKLAADTHKFEERYTDSMLGELPEAAPVYRDRSPVFHAEKIRRPLAVFQGDQDQVVPRDQSDTIVEALKRTGTAHIYHVYEGEGHGWRKRETIDHFYRAVEDFLRQHLIYA